MERRVRLADRLVIDSLEAELRLDVEELVLRASREDDRPRALRKRSGRALAGSVDELRCESSERQIAADYAVVVEGISDDARSRQASFLSGDNEQERRRRRGRSDRDRVDRLRGFEVSDVERSWDPS